LQKTPIFRVNNIFSYLIEVIDRTRHNSQNLQRFPQRGDDLHAGDFLLDKSRHHLEKGASISKKVGNFEMGGGDFEKCPVFRGNGYLFEILGEYSKKIRFIQERISS
jgi:hypothetical protein